MPRIVEIAAHTKKYTAGSFSTLSQYLRENRDRIKRGEGYDLIIFSEHNSFPSIEMQDDLRNMAKISGFDAWFGTHCKVFWDNFALQTISIGVYEKQPIFLGNSDINSLRDYSSWVHDNGGVIVGLNVHLEEESYEKSIVRYLDALAYGYDFAQDEKMMFKIQSICSMASPPWSLIKTSNCYYHKNLDKNFSFEIPDDVKEPSQFVKFLRQKR